MAIGYLNRTFALVCILAAGPAFLTPSGPVLVDAQQREERTKPAVRRKERKALASATTRWRRGKRPQAKPKRHTNRLHISKRVRRKHRKAA